MGHVSFHGRSLLTAPGLVMTPRAASERLVDAAVAYLDGRAVLAVDVGTGSGAIAIALAAAAPEARVYATDTSEAAVRLARANVRNCGLDARVAVCHGDLLTPVPGDVDLVVANLPYLAACDASRHADLDGEPWSAVFAPGDGLGPYRRLLAECSRRLADGGAVFVQLHRAVFGGTRAELPALLARLADAAREPELVAA